VVSVGVGGTVACLISGPWEVASCSVQSIWVQGTGAVAAGPVVNMEVWS
jgi:hypothetical protein